MGKRWNTGIKANVCHCGKPLITACLLLVLTGGCDDKVGPHKTTAATALPVAQQIPASGELTIELAPEAFHKLDFMELHGCLLQTTLGKFQSLLGRHASDSQRLLLNLEYLRLAPLCIKHNQHKGSRELAEQLLNLHNEKHQQLPALIYNATLANTEYQQFWRGTGQAKAQPGQDELSLAAMRAINSSVRRWLSGNYRASNLELEIQLSEVAKADSNGTQGIAVHQAVYKLEVLLGRALPAAYRQWVVSRE